MLVKRFLILLFSFTFIVCLWMFIIYPDGSHIIYSKSILNFVGSAPEFATTWQNSINKFFFKVRNVKTGLIFLDVLIDIYAAPLALAAFAGTQIAQCMVYILWLAGGILGYAFL